MIVGQMHDCKLRDWYNNIPICDGEHGISYYITYRSQFCFSDSDHFCMYFISSLFYLVLHFVFLCMRPDQGEFGVGECAVLSLLDRHFDTNLRLELGTWNLDWDSNLLLKIWTGTRIFDWELGLGLESLTGNLDWDSNLRLGTWIGPHIMGSADCLLCM